MLPSLHRLPATGVKRFRVEEENERQWAPTGAHEEELAPALEVAQTSLTDAPPEVIGLLVHRAAMNARSNAESNNPARAICNWMQNFCTAYAGKEEARKRECDDQWYRMAIEVFGYAAPTAPQGEQPQLPANSAFRQKGWRSLFHALCKAYAPNETAAEERFWTFFRTWDPRRSGDQGWPNERLDSHTIFDPTLTQRELDDYLLAVLKAGVEIQLDTPLDDPMNEPWTLERAGYADRLIRIFTLWANGKALIETDAAFIPKELTTPWMAVVTLLRLRGARVWDADARRNMYETYHSADEMLKGAYHLGDPGIEFEDLDYLTKRTGDALTMGADPNMDIFSNEPGTLLMMSVIQSNKILDALLKGGARIRKHWEANRIFGFLLYHAYGPSYMSENLADWPISLYALQRLIAMLAPYLKNDDRVMVRNRLDTAAHEFPLKVAEAWRNAAGPATD